MGYSVNNFLNNDDIVVKESGGPFSVLEYVKDLSVYPHNAATAFFCDQMNVRKRQVLCDLNVSGVVTQSGAMQWMVGAVEQTSGIKGAGDYFAKAIKGKATGESAVKPEYKGPGLLVLEPTYKHLYIIDLNDWNNSIVLCDGMFLACESHLTQKAIMRNNLSSAVLGGEGLFNLAIAGDGFVVCESPVPKEELIEISLKDDVVKIDGNMAVAWSSTLNFTVERSGKTLLGSAASGDGFVNVYRGTGKVLMAPVLGSIQTFSPLSTD